MAAQHQQHCSFCVKPSDQVAKLIAGAGVYICDGCVEVCNGILGASTGPDTTSEVTVWEQKSDDEILDALPRMAMVSAQADARIHALVELLRNRGVAWARIGKALGVTRQSAWERFATE